MNLVFTVVASLILSCHAEDPPRKEDSLNVTKNFRKALLEALEQLEKEEAQNKTSKELEKDILGGSDYNNNLQIKFGAKVKDKILDQERVVTSFADAGRENVFVHSFSTETKPVKDRNNDNLVRFRTKLATDNIISASATSSIAGNNNKFVNNKKETINVSSVPISLKQNLSSPSPTVPTPIEEDEAQAKVEDVQFIHAPLVAAFTVQQDAKGLPQKVIPIYGNKQPKSQFQNVPRQNIHISLEEKQRNLEQQIRILQEQKRQQEILLQQQVLQRQKFLFDEHQHSFNVQNNVHAFSQNLPQNFKQNEPIEVKHQQNKFNIPIPVQNDKFTPHLVKDLSNSISFQPSISFEPNDFKPINSANQNHQTQFNHFQFNQQQNLPIKHAINFQKAINIAMNPQDSQLIQQQIPNQFRNQVFNNNEDNFLQDFFYRQRTLVPPPRGNRFFRQETQVGNFGLNDFSSQNQFQKQKYNPVQNYRFSQFNTRNNFNQNRHQTHFINNSFQNNNVDNTLKNLLYQSGLGQSHSQEDLNIVSKVLALDHTGNYQQNHLFGESNVSEINIPYLNLNKAYKT